MPDAYHEIANGRLDPQVSEKFRDQLYKLATSPLGDDYHGAMAHLRIAAETLQNERLAAGTKLVIDPGGHTQLKSAGLPTLGVDMLDADVYYRAADDSLNIISSKASVGGLNSALKDGVEARNRLAAGDEDAKLSQTVRQTMWLNGAQNDEMRRVSLFAHDDGAGMNHMLDDRNFKELQTILRPGDERRLIMGARDYSANEMGQLREAGGKLVANHLDQQQAAHKASGASDKFDRRATTRAFVNERFTSPQSLMDQTGVHVGRQRPALVSLTRADMPSARQGGAWGGALAAGYGTAVAAADGRISREELGQIGSTTAMGAGAGFVAAAGEKALTPLVDRVAGPALQSGARSLAGQFTSSVTKAETLGAAGRTVGTRMVGSSVLGMAVSVGVSAYENRVFVKVCGRQRIK